MSEIPGINENASMRPSYVNNAADNAAGKVLNEKGVQLMREVAALLGTDRSVRVSNTSSSASTSEVGSPTGATGTPALDNPDDAKAKEVDLAKLISYLKLENDEQQAEMAKDRIESQKDNLETRHKDQMKQVQETLDELDKAAKANKINRIFGWLMAAFAFIAAVAACVVTGGVALGPLVGAALAITAVAMNETGAMEDLTELIADGLQEAFDLDENTAKMIASIAIAATAIVLSICSGQLPNIGTSLSSISQATALAVRLGIDITNDVMMAIGMTAGAVGSALNFTAGLAQADLSELEKFLAMMRQQLDESQEELQAILELIQNGISNLIDILSSETDTQNEIANQIGAMA